MFGARYGKLKDQNNVNDEINLCKNYLFDFEVKCECFNVMHVFVTDGFMCL